MGVAVLNPEEQALIFPPPEGKFLKPAANSKPTLNQNNRNGAKRSSSWSKNNFSPTRSTSAYTEKPQINKLGMGQVKILKRGELINTPGRASEAVKALPDKSRKFRIGPKLELISSEKAVGLYAGSYMFVASPPPSSVPLPAFLKTITTSDATNDLRRILRLDLS